MRLVKSSLALLAFVAVVWFAVLVTWQVQARTPEGDDLALYLVGLPLLLLAAYAVLRKVLGSLLGGGAARRAAAAPGQAAGEQPATAPAAPPPLALPVVRTALRSAHGNTPDDLLAASRAGARPTLDTELTDAAGYPQFAGRVPFLQADTLAGLFPSSSEGPQAVSDAAKPRAMAMLAEVLDELCEPLRHLQPIAGATPMRVRVSVLVDASWTEPDVAVLRRWLRDRLPADGAHRRLLLEIVGLPSGEASGVMAWIEREARAGQAAPASPASADEQPAFWLVAAGDSFVDQSVTETWAARGQLHGAANPQGLIAGEAAAGLLLALPGAAPVPEVDTADAVRLADIVHRDVDGRAERSSPDTLTALMDDLFTRRGIEPAAIVGVASDADHRRAKVGELAGGIAARLPELAIDHACVPIGQACGHTGGTAQLASLVMAAHLAKAEGGATLALAVTHSPQRSAALVVPATVPPPAGAA